MQPMPEVTIQTAPISGTNSSGICLGSCIFWALFSVLTISLAENTACLQAHILDYITLKTLKIVTQL